MSLLAPALPGWRRRMGVEPTRDTLQCRATVLKTARPTGTRPPPTRARDCIAFCALLERRIRSREHERGRKLFHRRLPGRAEPAQRAVVERQAGPRAVCHHAHAARILGERRRPGRPTTL